MTKQYLSTAGFHPRTGPLTKVAPTIPEDYGKGYLPEELDLFLDLFLGGRGHRAKKAIAEMMGRNEKAMTMLEWKIPTKYPPIDYRPHNREDRTGRAWHARDKQLLALGRGAEAVGRGVDTAYIAGVLGRTVADVEAHEAAVKQSRGNGFGL